MLMPGAKLAVAFLLAVAVAAVFAACGGNSSDTRRTAPPAAATSTGERTGIAGVDAIIDATLHNDGAALRRLIRFTSEPCTSQSDQVELPICGPEEAEGTPVDTITETITGLCRIAVRTIQLRADQINTNERPFTGVRLFAVYRTASSPRPDAYTAVFVSDPGDPGFAVLGTGLRIEGDRIVALEVHCGQTAEELVDGVSRADFLVGP